MNETSNAWHFIGLILACSLVIGVSLTFLVMLLDADRQRRDAIKKLERAQRIMEARMHQPTWRHSSVVVRTPRDLAKGEIVGPDVTENFELERPRL
jgi:hypothetical protein